MVKISHKGNQRHKAVTDFPVRHGLATAVALFLSLGRAPPALSTHKYGNDFTT
jgi:hypothetical protein